MTDPSRYEHLQYAAVCRWRDRAPTSSKHATQRATNRVGRAVGTLIPAPVLRVALQTVQATAGKLRDQRSILRRANATSLAELASGPLERCDALAQRVEHRSMLMAGTSGAVFGVTGVFGLAADIPTLLVIAFRGIHRVGLCYGEDCMTGESTLPLAVFALASANTLPEKYDAWAAIRGTDTTSVAAAAVRGSALHAVNQSVTKTTAALGFSRVARQAGERLGWRVACKAVPVAGAVIGSSVNAWYLHDIASAAQRAFQWRWLTAHHPDEFD